MFSTTVRCLLVVVSPDGCATSPGSLPTSGGKAVVESMSSIFRAMLTAIHFADQAYFAPVTFLGCVDDVGAEEVLIDCVCYREG